MDIDGVTVGVIVGVTVGVSDGVGEGDTESPKHLYSSQSSLSIILTQNPDAVSNSVGSVKLKLTKIVVSINTQVFGSS